MLSDSREGNSLLETKDNRSFLAYHITYIHEMRLAHDSWLLRQPDIS